MLRKHRPLALGFAAVAVPLLLVLGLQLWWLVRLHRTSIAAGRAVLTGFLDAVATEVVYSYGPAAERALDVPASLFAQDRLEKAAAHFRKRDVEGVKTLFVARFSKPFAASGTVVDDTAVPGGRRARGKNIKGFVTFPTAAGEQVLVKVGISAVSVAGARKNLETEISGWDFDEVRSRAADPAAVGIETAGEVMSGEMWPRKM